MHRVSTSGRAAGQRGRPDRVASRKEHATPPISPLALVHGRDVPLPRLSWLTAGPLTMALDGIDLRYVKLGDLEVVRRIYVGCATPTGTRFSRSPPSSWCTTAPTRSTSISRRATRATEVDFSWHGHIAGDPDGHLSYALEGQGERDMLYNRMASASSCPGASTSGRPFRGETPNGPISGSLPRLVAPQRFGTASTGRCSVGEQARDRAGGGPVAIFEFQGDLFEMRTSGTGATRRSRRTPPRSRSASRAG